MATTWKTIKAVIASLASPEEIKLWSEAERKGRERGEYGAGEVKSAETINYKTLKPEPGGLYCQKIFGPVKDYECACGKFKGRRYEGVICDRCGVEVTRSDVRRERMGYIVLNTPVVHPWFYKMPPYIIPTLLGIPKSKFELIINYDAYVILDPKKAPPTVKIEMDDGSTRTIHMRKGQVLSVEEYRKLISTLGPDSFAAGWGAEAIKKLLEELNEPIEESANGTKTTRLEALYKDTRLKFMNTTNPTERTRLINRLKIIEAFILSGQNPAWMVLEVIPVLPPDLRPLLPLEGGKFANTDLTDLYRDVIRRNHRLKQIYERGGFELMIINEKRQIKHAVEALIDNSRLRRPSTNRSGQRRKSLTDYLRGKKGLLRRNLLGKRVDYSGRAVIVVGPELKLHQVGLPKDMALELFKPWLEEKMERAGLAYTRSEKYEFIKEKRRQTIELLLDITKHYPVMLNRAPTLHRVSIQAFEPVLTEGYAIKLHPLVCAAYNADFDGDQMAVFVPIHPEAIAETYALLLAPHNILSPAHGGPLATASQDMVIGINYLTKEKPTDKKDEELPKFSGAYEVLVALENGSIHVNDPINVLMPTTGNPFNPTNDAKYDLVRTVAGRVVFASIIPEEMWGEDFTFADLNREYGKRDISRLVSRIYKKLGTWKTTHFLDDMKTLGFKWAAWSGVTFGVDDVIVPPEKEKIIKRAFKEIEQIERLHAQGKITHAEKQQRIFDIWTKVTQEVTEKMLEYLRKDKNGFNPLYMMVMSGARGNIDQTRQLGAMRGLMTRPAKKGQAGELIPTPVLSSLKEGLSSIEFFISSHGARKGLSDVAMKTADAGYLTRRLVDAAQEVVITMDDCGAIQGREVGALKEGETVIEPLSDRIVGRYTLFNVYHPVTNEVIVPSGEEITEEKAKLIENLGIETVKIRSVLHCQAPHGVCARCYGRNLATGKKVDTGEAVGIIAAQSIGEPGTQLTLRTKHTGGAAERIVGESKHIAHFPGVIRWKDVKAIEQPDGGWVVVSRKGKLILEGKGRKKEYGLEYGYKIYVGDGERVEKGDVLAEWDFYAMPILVTKAGKLVFEGLVEGVSLKEDLQGTTLEYVVEVVRHRRLYPKAKVIDPETGEVLEVIPLANDARLTKKAYEIFKGMGNPYVNPGEVIARVPRLIYKTRDITGGLPKVEELFEARVPKNSAVIVEKDGVVEDIEIDDRRGIIKIIIRHDDGTRQVYQVKYGEYLLVSKGDRVEAMDKLIEGDISPKDILRIKGKEAAAEYLLEEIQKVYRVSGVRINDKHIEIIIRQMLRRVRIVDGGNTMFLPEQIVDLSRVLEENRKVAARGGKPAKYEPILLGISKVAATTDSFLAAASFEEAPRVLAEAAVRKQRDNLKGLKERVIIGDLIPAGTGFPDWRMDKIVLEIEEMEEERETPET
ncbi:MAG: DNA-directed RNA polymerase subunit beta' [Thermotogae bacterium]|nr:DNA-directed RNA polymerase subunit beta' [Thermotogota bacterium]